MDGEPLRLFRWLEHHPGLISAAVGLSLVTVLASALLLPVVVSRLPADYFLGETGGEGWGQRHPAARFALATLKNVVGGVLVLAGVAMLVLPGQGLLTLLVGLCLMDFPGKRALELRLVRVPGIQRAIQWLRQRSGREPLRFPPD